ncbi:MAG: hypothetical protein HFH93_05750 [Lachnospiraceae bacterium]|nr:hypothetical protein [Clostridiaceae bacterium]MCI9337035.1 hypothetical protein [Lachnospiraceae bacterium]
MRRTTKNITFTVLLLTLSAAIVLLAYLYLVRPGDRDLSGEWVTELDMTKQAAARAYGWLQDIEAVSVSVEDVEAYMPELTIQVSLSFEQTDRFRGTFRCDVLPESYEACNQAAYDAFALAFESLVAERLRMAGYTQDTDSVEALIGETFGMSAASYLQTCGPALLPALEELQAEYNGSGIYEAGEDVLLRQFDGGGPAAAREESYVRKGSTLVLSGEAGSAVSLISEHYPIVYLLKQPQSQ